MPNKLTQHELILKYLRSVDGWVPSHFLEKNTLCNQWIGTRGSRSARDLAQEGKIDRIEGRELINLHGYSYDALGKPIDSTYAYYKAKAPARIEHYRIPETGEVYTKKIYV